MSGWYTYTRNDRIGDTTLAIFEKGVVMTTLQAVPSLNRTQKDFAPYLQKRRVIQRAALLSRTSSKRTSAKWDHAEQGTQSPEPGSVNLESMYFRGFRSRPLLQADEELKLGMRLYEGTTQLRSFLHQALDLTNQLQHSPELESIRRKLQKFLDEKVDADEIDESGEIPATVIKGLAKMGAFGIKIPKEYGGLERKSWTKGEPTG